MTELPRASRYPLTVVVTSCHRWNKLEATLAALLPQAAACGAETIVAVADRDGLPPGGLESLAGWCPAARGLVEEGAHIFQLRASAVTRASGEVIALLEDHNLVPAGWCEKVLAPYQADPELVAAIGAVSNGSERTRIDQANFLFNFGGYLPDTGEESWPRTASIAGSSFRRALLPPGPLPAGWLELQGFAVLRRTGRSLFSPGNAVTHVQSNDALRTLANHYHNARSCSGLRRQLQQGRGAVRGVATSVVLPGYFLWRWLRPPGRRVLDHGYRGALPWLVAIGFVYSFGYATGWLFGPGGSPWKLE